MRICIASLTLLTALLPAIVLEAQDTSSSAPPAGPPESASARWEPWTESNLHGSPLPPSRFTIEAALPHLQFEQPVVLTNAPNTRRMFLAELTGKIYSFAPDDRVQRADLAADMQKLVPGLTRFYGLTFDPEYPRRPFCYVCYILDANSPEGTWVSRFRVETNDPPQLLPGSEERLLRWPSGGHNGGCLKFGPDGYLYVSTGDGGPAFPPDPRQSGQDVRNVLSSILRIDVRARDGRWPYRIPADNPFLKLPEARPEVWAYGLRNPWKMSFDSVSGDLWVGDVGWELWEMIYRIERGGNYGWSLVEGRQPVHRERTRGPTPILPPTIEHSHTESRSITGGFVYRGSQLPELQGAYVYGDYVTGKLWGAWYQDGKVQRQEELVDTPLQIICFGTDHQQELYLVDYVSGTLHRLKRRPPRPRNQAFPRTLAATGLFASTEQHTMAPGVLPYSINAELWEDGAVAERYLAVPNAQPLDLYTTSNVQIGWVKGEWKFPSDSVLVKTLSVGKRRVETQLLHRDGDTWRGYSYLWNKQQTDAVLAPAEGTSVALRITDPGGSERALTWQVPSRTQCVLCHTTRSGSIQGFRQEQLNRVHGSVNQLQSLQQLGLFVQPLAKDRPALPSPYDAGADLEQRARAYLHVNCAHCHRRGGGGTAAIDLQHSLPLERTNLLNTRPTQGTFGILGAELLAPGDPYRSVLYYRMSKLGHGRMPYFGSSVVDQSGLQLIRDWILSLSAPESPDRVQRLRAQQAEQLAAWQRDPTDEEAITNLLRHTSGAMRLLDAVQRLPAGAEQAKPALRLATDHSDSRIRDLFERFVPESERSRTLGNVVQAEALLELSGDIERGRALFHVEERLQCRNCHRIGKDGKQVGPDLTAIASRLSRQELLESILEPSKRIDPKFQTYLAETDDGRVLSGLLLRKTDTQVVLKDATGKDIVLPAKSVEVLLPQQKSLMPDLQIRQLTAQQAADLLAYLGSLKKAGKESQ